MSDYKLKVRNTGMFLKVDPTDWGNVNGWLWFELNGVIVTRSGVPYEEIAKFPPDTKNKMGNLYDKRRENLIPMNKNWFFCEWRGKFVIE